MGLRQLYRRYEEHPAFEPLRVRTRFVPGEGNSRMPLVMFVGEAPGADEERAGRPFVGVAGQLLQASAGAAGFHDSNSWITNVVKYRPPGNRPPTPDEVSAARPFIRREMAIVCPEVVVPLGRHALQTILPAEKRGITAMHGKLVANGRWLVYPILHPSGILRSNGDRTAYAEVFFQLREILG